MQEVQLRRRGPSYLGRAIVAVALFFGFYVLALSLAAGLVWLPYAEIAYAHRIHPKLVLVCLGGAFVILRGSIFVPKAKFEPPGPEVFSRDEPKLCTFILARNAQGQSRPGTLRRLGECARSWYRRSRHLVAGRNAWGRALLELSTRGGRTSGRRGPSSRQPVRRISGLRCIVARTLGLVAGQALTNSGWSWTTGLGRPHAVTKGDETLPVFELALSIAKGENDGSELLARLLLA